MSTNYAAMAARRKPKVGVRLEAGVEGENAREFSSIRGAAQFLDVAPSTIRHAIKNGTKVKGRYVSRAQKAAA